MTEFEMIIKCKWCNKSIKIDPTPIHFDAITMEWIVDSERQKELIERHTGWVAGMDAFCSDEHKWEYTNEKNIDDFDDYEKEGG